MHDSHRVIHTVYDLHLTPCKYDKSSFWKQFSASQLQVLFIELYVHVLPVSNSTSYLIHAQVSYRETPLTVRLPCGKTHSEESQYMYYIYNIAMNMSIVFDFISIL